MRPKTVAITGGPAAGKSTIIERLKQELGSKVLVVEEAATALLDQIYPNVGDDLNFDEEWLVGLQRIILEGQNISYPFWLKKAETQGIKLVIFDRAQPDCAAYTKGGQREIAEKFGLDFEKVFADYDMAIHLESVASFDPDLYDKVKGSNPMRRETSKQAAALDVATRNAWEGHPNWQFVTGKGGLDYLYSKVRNLLSRYVDVEMERKFILKELPKIDLGEGQWINQEYFNGYNDSGSEEMRIRSIADERYFLTVKTGEGVIRQEWETEVPEWVYKAVQGINITSVDLQKIRYVVKENDEFYEIDVYQGRLEGLIILEVQTEGEEEVVLPDWAEVEREVTGQVTNYNLASLNSWGVGWRK